MSENSKSYLDETYHDEDTMRKVWEALGEAGVEPYAAQDAVSLMQNAGILFRERADA